MRTDDEILVKIFISTMADDEILTSGGSEPDDVDLGPGDLSDDGSHSSRKSSSSSTPPTLPTAYMFTKC